MFDQRKHIRNFHPGFFDRDWFRLTNMGRPTKKPSDFDARLGMVVRSKRVKAALTRKEMAEVTGIAEANLKRREMGVNEITVSELTRIAAAVRTPPAEIAEEALADYGGLHKLIAEHTELPEDQYEVTEEEVTEEDNVIYLGHVTLPAKIAAKKKKPE